MYRIKIKNSYSTREEAFENLGLVTKTRQFTLFDELRCYTVL